MTDDYNFFKNTSYALKGLLEIWKSETSFRTEIFILAPLLILQFFFEFTLAERLLLILSALGVLIVECVNSAIERAVDLITKDFNALAGAAKDASSAAVFFSIVTCVLVWGAVIANSLLK